MNLELVRIENAGDLERERVVLRATAETDAGWYAVFRCHQSPPNSVFAGSVPNAYWFPSRKLNPKDWVVLYSKRGSLSEKKGDGGAASSYFFYWNENVPLWVPAMIPVLVETPNWAFGKAVESVKRSAS